jgi:hypothetical protein
MAVHFEEAIDVRPVASVFSGHTADRFRINPMSENSNLSCKNTENSLGR